MRNDLQLQQFKFFVWNDEPAKASSWEQAICDDNSHIVKLCSKTDATAVLNEFKKDYYDIVILDVVFNDEALGIDIAEGIRKGDPLVPIIAVTKFPERVYDANDLQSIMLSGIFQEAVMKPVVFKDVVLRPTLDQWHLSLIEFTLVRYSLYQFEKYFKKTENDHLRNRFKECLKRLPFSPSIQSWHCVLCEMVTELLDNESSHLSSLYSEIVKLFQQAEPFHKAADLGRRHLSHNVQVFFMGLIIILEDSFFQKNVFDNLKSISESDEPEDVIFLAIIIWGALSTTHDVAYLCQDLNKVYKELGAVAKKFSNTMSALGENFIGFPDMDWPIKRHGEIGSELWSQLFDEQFKDTKMQKSNREEEILKLIVNAIYLHDKKEENCIELKSESWADFLLVMCDELQDWHREGKDKAPGTDDSTNIAWRLFALEKFEIRNEKTDNGEKTRLVIRFAAKDFPDIVRSYSGSSGSRTVQQRFNFIKKILKERLSCKQNFEIELSCHFISRDVYPATSRVIIKNQE